jgi:stage III sporulation protein SpoIIIAA
LYNNIFIKKGPKYAVDETALALFCKQQLNSLNSSAPTGLSSTPSASIVQSHVSSSVAKVVLPFSNASTNIICFNEIGAVSTVTTEALKAHCLTSRNSGVVAFDLEGFNENDGYCIAQLSVDGKNAFLFDKFKGKESIQRLLLDTLVSLRSKILLLHDCHHDVLALGQEFVNALIEAGVVILDTQLVYEYFSYEVTGGLNKYLSYFQDSNLVHDTKKQMKTTFKEDPCQWERRPLSSEQIQYAAKDVLLLHQSSSHLLLKLNQENIVSTTVGASSLLSVLVDATIRRINSCFTCGNGEQKFFSFDHENRLVSRELYEAFQNVSLVRGSGVRSFPDYRWLSSLSSETSRHSNIYSQNQFQALCSCTSLMKLFPEHFYSETETRSGNDDHFLKIFDENHFATSVCDIVLDYGKRPHVWLLNDLESFLFPLRTDYLISKSDLEDIVCQLEKNGNQFGNDNRIGIEGELHRISAIRNKLNIIIGLTIRIGRFFIGNSYILSDLLLHSDYSEKSILVLGPPGAGKTSLIREIARCLSEKQNVMIVDTSNEICGDSDVTHSCVGKARRMMVSSIDEQHQVMIECVQNHTPKVMIIDEIGRKKEVDAAKTCKERGVRLIASAHGDFRSLLKNSELNKLIGGSTSVTLCDETAKKMNHGHKMTMERAGAPIFDIVIEVKKGKYNEFVIIKDSGKTVDKILSGDCGKAEKRERILSSGSNDSFSSASSSSSSSSIRSDPQVQNMSFSFIDF